MGPVADAEEWIVDSRCDLRVGGVWSVSPLSMSLDGFIIGPDDDVGQGLGSGGERLHDWLDDEASGFRPSGPSGEILDELMATGAVLVGRRTFDFAGRWDGDHHGVPIFVPTRESRPRRRLT